MKIIAKFLTFTFLGCNTCLALDIKEALVSTYNSNPTLLGERANLEANDEQIMQAISGFLPSVTLQGNRGKMMTKPHSFKSSVSDWVFSRGVNVTQPIFNNGANVNSILRAKKVISASRERLRSVEQNTLLNAVVAYVSYLQSDEVLNLNKVRVNVLQKKLESTEQRFELGEVTKTDVAQAKSRLSLAKTDLAQAEGNLVRAKSNFRKIIGLEPTDVKAPTETFALPASIDDMLKLSIAENPDFLLAKYLADVAAEEVNISKYSLLPVVNLSYQLSKDRGLNSSQNSLNRTALVNVTVPIFQGGAEYSRIRASKAGAKKAMHNVTDSKDTVTNQAISAWESYEVAKSSLTSTEEAVNAAQIALEGVKQEVEVGTRTTLDELDAEQELHSAKVEHVKAKNEKIVSVYSLLASIGKLNAKELNLQTKIYDPIEHYNKIKLKLIGF